MDVLFGFILFIAFIFLILGLIKPKLAFMKSRKRVLLIYPIILVISFIGIGATADLEVAGESIPVSGKQESEKPKENSEPVTNDKEEEKEEESKVEEKTKEEKEKTASIGDELQVGNVTFKVNEFFTTDKISDGNGFISYTPDADGAVFLVVNLSIKNVGKEAITTDSSFFKILDGDISYSPSTVIIMDDKYFLYDSINPGLGMTGNVLFEVPEGVSDLVVQVQTGFWGTETGLINLK